MAVTPFPEQIEAIRKRTGRLIPTKTWRDVDRNAHDRGFMVAGATSADLLADFARTIDKVISEGKSIEWFRNNFDEFVGRAGWEYNGERNWRTRVIYRTNVATTYATGRLAQLRDPKLQEAAPFWLYRHGGSADPRPEHLEWDGTVLPADDPWWDTHYPPNDWGCSCYVTAVSRETAERLGGKFERPTTGAPGEGWDYQPGAGVADDIRNTLRDKAEVLPGELAGPLLSEMAGSEAFQNWYKSPEGLWPIARLPGADAQAIGSKRLVAMLSAQTAKKQLRKHPELTRQEYARVQQVMQNPSRKIQEGQSIIYVDEQQLETGYVLVVKATRTGEGLFVSSYRRLSSDQARRDKEIARLLRKR